MLAGEKILSSYRIQDHISISAPLLIRKSFIPVDFKQSIPLVLQNPLIRVFHHIGRGDRNRLSRYDGMTNRRIFIHHKIAFTGINNSLYAVIKFIQSM